MLAIDITRILCQRVLFARRMIILVDWNGEHLSVTDIVGIVYLMLCRGKHKSIIRQERLKVIHLSDIRIYVAQLDSFSVTDCRHHFVMAYVNSCRRVGDSYVRRVLCIIHCSLSIMTCTVNVCVCLCGDVTVSHGHEL